MLIFVAFVVALFIPVGSMTGRLLHHDKELASLTGITVFVLPFITDTVLSALLAT
jgi:hypothetical protein